MEWDWSGTTYYSDLYQFEWIENQLVAWGPSYYSSDNFGDYWEFVSLDYNQFLSTNIYNISFFKKTDISDDILWVGGSSIYFEPFVIRSVDGGNNWTDIPLYSNHNIYFAELVLDPQNIDIVYLIDIEGKIYKSVQKGDDWLYGDTFPNFIFTHESNNTNFSIEINSINSNHIFTSGGSKLYQSFDEGLSWSEIITPLPESEIISNLLFDVENNQLIINTWNSGVLSLNEW